MGERETISIRMDVDVADALRAFTVETKGKKRGEMGRIVERAVLEYMDRDRFNRIEENQKLMLEELEQLRAEVRGDSDTHTHASSGSVSPAVRSAREVVAMAVDESDGEGPIPGSIVEDAIVEKCGADSRTIDKYTDVLKSKQLLYQHPLGNVWTDDGTEWAEWVESNPVDFSNAVEPYGLSVEEYEQLLPEDVGSGSESGGTDDGPAAASDIA